MHIDFKTVAAFIIVLDYVALGNIEHTAGTDERNFRTGSTSHRNSRGCIAVFRGTGLQSHRNLNILNIVLGHGEDFLVADHV